MAALTLASVGAAVPVFVVVLPTCEGQRFGHDTGGAVNPFIFWENTTPHHRPTVVDRQ